MNFVSNWLAERKNYKIFCAGFDVECALRHATTARHRQLIFNKYTYELITEKALLEGGKEYFYQMRKLLLKAKKSDFEEYSEHIDNCIQSIDDKLANYDNIIAYMEYKRDEQ